MGAEKQSARAQQALGAYNARAASRVAIQTSKSQATSRFFSLEVALADIIEALATFKGVVAESKGQYPTAFREPEHGPWWLRECKRFRRDTGY
jgi:ABC-type hemin transport system substrate-binding protein